MGDEIVSDVPVPPVLPYSLRDRKRSITIFWSLFLLDTLVQPLAFYFVLWYCTDLSHNLGAYASSLCLVLNIRAERKLMFKVVRLSGSLYDQHCCAGGSFCC